MRGERIEKLELRLGTEKRKMANAKKTFCYLAISIKKWQI